MYNTAPDNIIKLSFTQKTKVISNLNPGMMIQKCSVQILNLLLPKYDKNPLISSSIKSLFTSPKSKIKSRLKVKVSYLIKI